MDAREEIFNILIDNHGTHYSYLDSNNDEISIKNFSNLCKEFIYSGKKDQFIKEKIKNILLNIPDSMVSQIWYPIAKLCDIITYYNCSNKTWIDSQLNDIDESLIPYFNIISYGNLARVAITYPFTDNGRKCISLLNKALFNNDK
ncbi:hypothetical protein DpV84gp138 [Deerpox virus W-1170-84]|uniref:Uncharacterized protein n=1 Tax=Deerpox virus (strain W-1170-84) TaxID=305676 RepID=Q08F43_DPV84|nr:hypothetical protein DpV84gp138 [Deerpox virus W-1170-84]